MHITASAYFFALIHYCSSRTYFVAFGTIFSPFFIKIFSTPQEILVNQGPRSGYDDMIASWA